MKEILKGLPALNEFAKRFLATLTRGERAATVVGLSGDLGAGKTAFTKEIARELGVDEEIHSPTFVIAKFYDLPSKGKWQTLVHVDAYRIEDPKELAVLRWEEIVSDPRNLVLIEWPEQIGVLFPSDAPLLRFKFVDEGTRAVQWSE